MPSTYLALSVCSQREPVIEHIDRMPPVTYLG